jgi:hypothetical protein
LGLAKVLIEGAVLFKLIRKWHFDDSGIIVRLRVFIIITELVTVTKIISQNQIELRMSHRRAGFIVNKLRDILLQVRSEIKFEDNLKKKNPFYSMHKHMNVKAFIRHRFSELQNAQFVKVIFFP